MIKIIAFLLIGVTLSAQQDYCFDSAMVIKIYEKVLSVDSLEGFIVGLDSNYANVVRSQEDKFRLCQDEVKLMSKNIKNLESQIKLGSMKGDLFAEEYESYKQQNKKQERKYKRLIIKQKIVIFALSGIGAYLFLHGL